MKLDSEDLRSAIFRWSGFLMGSAYIFDTWVVPGNNWAMGLLLVLLGALFGLSFLIESWSAFCTGELHSFGVDWEAHDYYFKFIVAIHLLLTGFSFWVSIYFLQIAILR